MNKVGAFSNRVRAGFNKEFKEAPKIKEIYFPALVPARTQNKRPMKDQMDLQLKKMKWLLSEECPRLAPKNEGIN